MKSPYIHPYSYLKTQVLICVAISTNHVYEYEYKAHKASLYNVTTKLYEIAKIFPLQVFFFDTEIIFFGMNVTTGVILFHRKSNACDERTIKLIMYYF